MISHLPLYPLLVPLIAGILTLMLKGFGIQMQRRISSFVLLLLLFVNLWALGSTLDTSSSVYALGGWQPPYGITLVLDKLSALMVLLTSLVALGAFSYALFERMDTKSLHFHPLFWLQIFGINGAFLTGDLFNLFVFFEILLIASYSLILHGNKEERVKAGLHYVILNLVGSALFLLGIGTLYGLLGTLNIQDLALKIATLAPSDVGIVAAAGLLLLVVFGLKAAMFPLSFWLVHTYSNISAPVVALFAILTKVGIYAILRVHGTLFGADAGALSYYYTPWILNLGLLSLIFSTLGVMASASLKNKIGYLVLVSISLLLILLGINTQEAISAAIYYTIHSTLIAGGFFLFADLLLRKNILPHIRLVGGIFFAYAVAIVGLPPFAGFFAKVMLLQAALENTQQGAIFTLVLTSTLLIMISLTRLGSQLFYEQKFEHDGVDTVLHKRSLLSILFLFFVTLLLVIFAQAITEFLAQLATEALHLQEVQR
jgi:multicomponent K+:H+ antiporter subunit D